MPENAIVSFPSPDLPNAFEQKALEHSATVLCQRMMAVVDQADPDQDGGALIELIDRYLEHEDPALLRISLRQLIVDQAQARRQLLAESFF